MAIEDAYQLAKDLHQETQAFKEPWFNLERILVVRSYPRCAVILISFTYSRCAVTLISFILS